MTHDEIIQYLKSNQIYYQLHEHAAVRTVREVEEILPHFLPTMVKTVAFRIKDGGLVLAAARGYDRIDYKKIGVVLGISRRKVRPISPQDVLENLGVEAGGVTPLPLRGARVLVDRHVAQMDLMHSGSGLLTATLEMRAAEFVAKSGVEVVDLVRDTT